MDYTSNLLIDSRFTAKDFAPDGRLGKTAWRKAKWIRFDHDGAGKRNFPEAETRVASCWTAKHVYFAFWNKYSRLNLFPKANPAQEKWGLWNRDVEEAFLNPHPEHMNHYYEFEVAPNNLWIDLEININRKPFNDASWNSHFQHATRVGKRVWVCEMRIPVEPMTSRTYSLRPKVEWRGNFYRADGLGDDAQRRLLAWSPTLQANFHVPARFGTLRFVK